MVHRALSFPIEWSAAGSHRQPREASARDPIPKAVTGAEVSLHEPYCRVCVFQDVAAMSAEQTPGIPGAICGRGLHLGDVVIVSREVPPSWALPVEQTMTAIVHQACEPGEVGPITTGCGRLHRPCFICW